MHIADQKTTMFHPPSILEYIVDFIILNLVIINRCEWNTILSAIIAIGTIARLAVNLYNDWINRNNRKNSTQTNLKKEE